ncbi:MAG: tetratricopeptide repeat protein, partial [Verrucomicrobia bacterium]|nr:tetratricopeptide repeat protein [Verrucomicrobiota bacterium]
IDLLKDLAKARPQDALPLLTLSDFYFKQLKKPQLAMSYAERAVRLEPENTTVYQTLFEIYGALQRREDAEKLLISAAKVNSKDPSFWLNIVDLALHLYHPENRPLQASTTLFIDGLLQKAISFAAGDAAALSRAADAYVQLNEVNNAIPLYLQTLELNRTNADVRYKLAASFVKNGQRDEAIRMLEDIVKANPLRFEIYEFLARLYEENGQKERALANYEQALLLAPDQPENYLHTADIALQLKHYDQAIQVLQDARGRFPIPQITYSLALALANAKQFSESLPIFESTLQEAKSNQEEIIDSNFYFNYGAAAEQAGLIEKAATLLKRSIELDPAKAANAYNYLGFMWVDRGMNLDEAGQLIKKALEIEPENGAYLDSLGWYYYHKNSYQKALAELLHAADLTNPPDPEVFEHIGDTYRALGNSAQALSYWQKALNLNSKDAALASKIDQSKAKMTANPAASPMQSNSPMIGPSPAKSE